MRIRRVLIYAALAFSAVVAGWSGAVAAQGMCGAPTRTTLIAGRNIDAGSVTVSNDENGTLYVRYSTTDPWRLTQTHLAVALSLEGIPQKNGNPIPGQFPYQRSYDPPAAGDMYELPGYTAGESVYIAAHAVVVQINETGEVSQSQTGWGGGLGFPGKNWAMYFTYTVQACEPVPPPVINPGDFRTQTQGGWGTVCKGGNPGCYRDAHFAEVFPNGLLIGNAVKGALFESSDAVQAFLPQGGEAGALSEYSINPTTTSAGVLAGQVTALTLSVNFDLADPNFGASEVNLADLLVASGDCYNMRVAEVLIEANKVLAGEAGGFTPSEINGCVSAINENFIDGTEVGSYLVLP